MKVYFVNSVVDYGSTGKIVRDLSDELIKENHDVRIAYGRHSSKNDDHTFVMSSTIGFINHYVNSRFFGRHGLHSTPQTKALIEDINNFKPDVIHIHNLHGYYLNVPMFLNAIKDMDVKVIITLHDTWLVSGSSAYFDYDGCEIWNEGCVVCNNTKSYPRSDLFKRQVKNFNWKKDVFKGFKDLTFISPSVWLKDVIQTTFLSDYKCEVVNNGIDTSIFYERDASELKKKYKSKKIILGVASIWEKRKGFDDFIELSKIISDEYIIVLIGLSEKQIKNLPSNIIGLQRTSNADELAEYYSAAYVYANPTYEDNYPTTNLEARSCNTPIVAYDTGGNKEVEGSSIVKKGDIKGFYQLIEKLEDKPYPNNRDYSKQTFIKNMMKHY